MTSYGGNSWTWEVDDGFEVALLRRRWGRTMTCWPREKTETTEALVTSNRFDMLEVEEPIGTCYFLQLPHELRDKVYDIVLQRMDDVRKGRDPQFPARRYTPARLGVTAAAVSSNLARTCRLVQCELLQRQIAGNTFHIACWNLDDDPRNHLLDTERERFIVEKARKYELWGNLGTASRRVGAEFDISCRLSFDTTKTGYRFEWTLDDDGSLRGHEEVLIYLRVQEAVESMVAERRERDGISGMTWDGLLEIVGALYLLDRVEHTLAWLTLIYVFCGLDLDGSLGKPR